jgi:putative hydrolase of the HAD superfamily
MTLKAVLFDFDDTLVDTSGSREERARRAHRRLLDDGHEVAWSPFWRSVNALAGDGYRRGMTPVMRDLGLEGTALGRECIDLWFFKGCEDLVSLSQGCFDLLDDLRHTYRLGIITNGPADVQSHKFDHTGLSEYFELFLPSGELGIHKPDPRIFHVALERLGIGPHEAVFIGDHLDLDVTGAQRAGLPAVWYNPNRWQSEHPLVVPEAEISRLADLPGVLSKLG